MILCRSRISPFWFMTYTSFCWFLFLLVSFASVAFQKRIQRSFLFSMVEEAATGKFLHSDKEPPCPPPPSPFGPQEVLSERTLKVCLSFSCYWIFVNYRQVYRVFFHFCCVFQIILLVSGFCLLVAVYYVIDVLFDNEANSDVTDLPTTPDGSDSASLIPSQLAEQDRIRLR